jgi:hypothetical protein
MRAPVSERRRARRLADLRDADAASTSPGNGRCGDDRRTRARRAQHARE